MKKALASGIILVVWLAFFLIIPARATSGTPESPRFGYGAKVDVWGADASQAVQLAAQLGLDWIAVDFDWSRFWPDPAREPDLSRLDQLLRSAQGAHISVLLSIRNAPAWALTAGGPDASLTASLLLRLVQSYPGTLQAVELFPGLNTLAGWQAAPDPAAYLELVRSAQAALATAATPVYLVTTLVPLSETLNGDIPDTAYLASLYQLGGQSSLSIIGLLFPALAGEPLASPSSEAPLVLRHYEQVRETMLSYDHAAGLIWITGFTWPAALPAQPDGAPQAMDTSQQAAWLSQAYHLLKSQLYIGLAFFNSINEETSATHRLLLPNGSFHPAVQVFIDGSSQDPLALGVKVSHHKPAVSVKP